MAEIKSLLDSVIEQEIQNVKSLASGSNEKSSAIRDLATLHKLRIEEIKAETEAEDKHMRQVGEQDDRDRDEQFKHRQLRDQLIDRCMRTGMDIAGLVLPLVFYGIWMNKGFKFEETGSFTSTTFKNLLNRFRPTK